MLVYDKILGNQYSKVLIVLFLDSVEVQESCQRRSRVPRGPQGTSLPTIDKFHLQTCELRIRSSENNHLKSGLAAAATKGCICGLDFELQQGAWSPFPLSFLLPILKQGTLHIINRSSSVCPTWVSMETPCAQLPGPWVSGSVSVQVKHCLLPISFLMPRI
jgi:hypothetical protein